LHYHRNKCGATLPCFSRYVAAATHASSSPGGTVTEERRPSPRKGRERQHFPQHTSHSTYPLPRAHPILFVHLPPAPDLSTLMHALYELIALKHVECTRLRPQVTTVVDTRALNAVRKHTHRVKGQGMMPRDGIDLRRAVFRGAERPH